MTVRLAAGVDCSTTATKVVLRRVEDGKVVGQGSATHGPTGRPPRSEQNPEDWLTAFEAAFAGALRSGGYALGDVVALSVAAQQHGLVLLDAQGFPVRPAVLWNDMRSAPDADCLLRELDAPSWARRAGSVPQASFTISKLAWLRRTDPECLSRAAHVLLPHDFLTQRLTGRRVTDAGDASGTGWFCPSTRQWDEELLALAWPDAPASALCELLAPAEPAGTWQGIMVGVGTGDNMASALGLGMQSGDLCLSFGTSGVAYSIFPEPICDESGTVAGFCDATGRHLPLVCTLNAMKVLDWARYLLGVDQQDFDTLAESATPGAAGLTLLPYFDGERTPNRPGARGILYGISSSTSRAEVARAAVEAAVSNLVAASGELERIGVESSGRVLLTGGGASSTLIQTVTAQLLGVAVSTFHHWESVAAGAAVQAAAVWAGRAVADVAADWAPVPSRTVAPLAPLDTEVLQAHHALRQAVASW